MLRQEIEVIHDPTRLLSFLNGLLAIMQVLSVAPPSPQLLLAFRCQLIVSAFDGRLETEKGMDAVEQRERSVMNVNYNRLRPLFP